MEKLTKYEKIVLEHGVDRLEMVRKAISCFKGISIDEINDLLYYCKKIVQEKSIVK